MIGAELLVKASSWFLSLAGSAGETWPGELALRLFPSLEKDLPSLFEKVIFVVGTNGKTSTTKSISELLTAQGHRVITNPSGANLKNGLVSNILRRKQLTVSRGYWGVFEVDEFSFPAAAAMLPPTHVLFLNVVRDQLDRYGEVRSILASWEPVLKKLPNAHIIANAADPGIYTMLDLLQHKRVTYYGIPKEFLQKKAFVAGDSLYCYACSHKLEYQGMYVSHMGAWRCPLCKRKPHKPFLFSDPLIKRHPDIPSFMFINLQSVYVLFKDLGITKTEEEVLRSWEPAYGRGEKQTINGTDYTFVLGKNPASWSVVLRDYTRKLKLSPVDILVFGLNNRIPDGKDVSWIWDVDIALELKNTAKEVWVYGDRAFDMQLRLQEAGIAATYTNPSAHEFFKKLKQRSPHSTLTIANYSALLEARKEVLGKSIL